MEVEKLRRANVAGLREKYREVFGEETRSHYREHLVRRIAWRLQARAEGDLSERARQRALEIADDAELRIRAPEGFFPESAPGDTATVLDRAGAGRDRRRPVPGTVLTRDCQRRRFEVN